nr:unnamed protein product [Callosobruchus chinensis]
MATTPAAAATETVSVVQSLSIPVSPSSKFDFTAPQAWPQWRKRFERFMSVSGQNMKPDEEKINILMYVLGEEAEEVMLQFNPQPATFSQTLNAFENHFIPRRNIIFERYKFNTRIQQQGEPIECFITSLHSLAEHCQYGQLKEELIRDRIVVGMQDRRTSERLQLKATLTLSECVLEAKQAELQANQSRELQCSIQISRGATSGTMTSAVAGLNVAQNRGRSVAKQNFSPANGGRGPNLQNKCQFCGLVSHPREQCPANKSTCRSCKKQGHWAVVCRSNKVRSIQTENLDDSSTTMNDSCLNCNSHNHVPQDNQFLGSIQVNHISEKEWVVPLEILEIAKKFNFMIDSGADITGVPVKLLNEDILQCLSRTNRNVTGPSGESLNVLGILNATLCGFNKRCQTDIYVIEQLCKPILGRSEIKKLSKDLVIADALSRCFPDSEIPEDDELVHETDVYVNLLTSSFEVKAYLMDQIKQEQNQDLICKTLREYTRDGWPSNKNLIKPEILPYFQYRFKISECDGYLLRGTRLKIPKPLQSKIIGFIHQGHQGIVKCRARAKSAVWWLGLSTEIENLVRNCPQCVEHRINKREPFVKDSFPERPWQKVAIDLLKLDGFWYMIVVDYFSRYFEIFKLTSLTSTVVITKLKELFSRFGIPEVVRSDNGSQFRHEFQEFAKCYDFKFITSSPYFSQSNGCVEASVKTAKNLIKKGGDMYLSLLDYRTTPLENGFSPAELMFNHKIRSHLPVLPKVLNQKVDTSPIFRREERYRNKMSNNYNKRHRVKELSNLRIDDSVWVTDLKLYGKVIKKLDEPRSYLIETNSGIFRRNRWHLIPARYHHFVPNNFEYHSCQPEPVTPALSDGSTPTNNVADRESDSENVLTDGNIVNHRFSSGFANGDSARGNLETSVSGNRGDSDVRSRPVRNINRPVYLNDFVTDF